jgi:hypothetical protein
MSKRKSYHEKAKADERSLSNSNRSIKYQNQAIYNSSKKEGKS